MAIGLWVFLGIGIVFGAALASLGWERTRLRIYRYARNEANRRDVLDPKGQAYSDMATVIILDGKVEDTSRQHVFGGLFPIRTGRD